LTGSSDDYDPTREEEPADDNDDQSVLDESDDEAPAKKKKVKQSGPRQLRHAVQTAQGKSMAASGDNPKRKASQTEEEWVPLRWYQSQKDWNQHTRNDSHKQQMKKLKKAKMGLHDNWAERIRNINAMEDQRDMEGYEPTVVNTDQSRSSSYRFSGSHSSHLSTQPNSEDDNGIITDDEGDEAERGKLSEKAIAPYYGSSSARVSSIVACQGCC
jgi:hypothetical protein